MIIRNTEVHEYDVANCSTPSKTEARPERPADLQAELIADLTHRLVRGERINGQEVVGLLDPNTDNRLVRDWLVQNRIMKGSEFDRALAQHKRRCRIEDRLGFYPNNINELVAEYAKREHISYSYTGLLERRRPTVWQGIAITDADREQNLAADNIARIMANDNNDMAGFRRELRLLCAELGLPYSDTNIDDATQTWADEHRLQEKVAIFNRISFTKGLATGPHGQAQWEELERAAFDVSDACSGFAVAVIRKFIWQVKRKMLNLPIYNHLMPVLTGAQGKGKSTLVRLLLRPVKECTANSDFKQITDDRNIDLWKSFVIFMDEMGHAKRTEIEEVKNIITAQTLARRPMRTNDMLHVEQRATFIGCCNKGLSELIKDETGVRRFAELTFTNTPDWEAINNLDWELLWRSVDERGPDPSESVAEVLADQQAGNRTISAVELWADQQQVLGKKRAEDLHVLFREWEQHKFPRHPTDITSWGKEMKRLIRNNPDFPWVTGRDNKGIWYSRA